MPTNPEYDKLMEAIQDTQRFIPRRAMESRRIIIDAAAAHAESLKEQDDDDMFVFPSPKIIGKFVGKFVPNDTEQPAAPAVEALTAYDKLVEAMQPYYTAVAERQHAADAKEIERLREHVVTQLRAIMNMAVPIEALTGDEYNRKYFCDDIWNSFLSARQLARDLTARAPQDLFGAKETT